MFLVVSRHLVPRGFGGLAIFPFIFLASMRLKGDSPFINHERIHLRQQAEMLVIPFYVFYLLNYLVNLMKYGKHREAYRQIVFEREAYAKDGDGSYLTKRRPWAFVSYL